MKKVLVTFGIATIAILGLQSCKESGKDSKQTSEVKEEVKASKEAETYTVNTVESKVKWIGKTMMSSHFGHILLKGGEITVKDGKLESGSYTVGMNSIKSEDLKDAEMAGKLDGHLKGEDFFDVAKYPEAKFTITSVKSLEGKFNSELEGNLELKGISKNLSVKANTKVEGGKVTLATEKFTINRQDFKITYTNGGPKDKVIDDLFDLEITIIADKK